MYARGEMDVRNPLECYTEKVQKTVLITGGSSGIGFELAKIFGKNNFHVIIVAQDKNKLSEAETKLEASGYSVKTISKDLSDPHSPSQIYKELQSENITIDVLVNNAGFAVYGQFAETDIEQELSLLQVNIVSLTRLTKLFLPEMIKRRSGKILNIASIAAFAPGPLMAVYYASKAYVLSFSEALSEELIGTGVHVTAVCPGPTDTGFVKRGGVWNSSLYQGRHMTASFVAEEAFKGLMKNQAVIVPGWKNKLIVNSLRFVPRSIAPKILIKLQAKI